MPELPEVETIARGLASRVTGEVIESVWLGQKKEPLKSPATAIAAALEQSRLAAIRRMGKHIVFDMEQRNMWRTLPSAGSGQAQSAKARKQKASRKGSSSTRPLPHTQADKSVRPTKS